jgi:hypothetical protein
MKKIDINKIMATIQVSDKELTELRKKETYMNLYYRALRMNITHQDAYRFIDQLHAQQFGKPRYKTFDSFRKIRDRYLSGK